MKVERVGAREKGEERAPHAHSGHHLQVNKSEALNREHSGKVIIFIYIKLDWWPPSQPRERNEGGRNRNL